MNEKEAIIIINRFKGITTAPVNTEEVREACRLAIEALRKQVPREPMPEKILCYGNGMCPTCGAVFVDKATKHCGNCGQALLRAGFRLEVKK